MREDFTFTVNLIAVVRVRAGDENVARQVVPTVLGAPGTAEIGLANQNNVLTGRDATVSSVDFSIGPIKASKPLDSKPLEKRAKLVALAKSWPKRATGRHSRSFGAPFSPPNKPIDTAGN